MSNVSKKDKIKKNFTTPDLPKRIIIAFIDGYCNLKCPMCFVHGQSDPEAIKKIRGIMPIEKARIIFEEIKSKNIIIGPSTWSEPFILKDMNEYLKEIKSYGFNITLNTNSLLLKKKDLQLFIDIEIDSIFFSVDAMTDETLFSKRGIKKLSRIRDTIFSLLELRGNLSHPRIGVSYTLSIENLHEKESFIEYWLKYVDVVRINNVIDSINFSTNSNSIPKERIPCGMLYDTMVLNHKGDAVICCLDAFYEYKLGNVFDLGVKNLWHSKKFNEIRKHHEDKKYYKIPICQNCQIWADYLVEEKIKDNILIKKSPITTYYNRIEKMYSWKIGGK